MSLGFVFLITKRYLFGRHKEFFLSIINLFSFLGIMIGVAALIIVMSVMNGFHQRISDGILGLSGHIIVTGSSGRGIEDYQSYVNEIKDIEGVMSVVANIQSQAMLTTEGGRYIGVAVHGLSHGDLYNRPVIFDNIISGVIDINDFEETAFIGDGMAAVLGVKVGDVVRMAVPNGIASLFGFLPLVKDVRIGGIFKSGLYDYDNNLLCIPLTLAQNLFDYKNAVNVINISLASDQGTANVVDLLSRNNNDVKIETWQNRNGNLFHALRVERSTMFCILTLILIIALFNIISGLVMLVYDKRSGIAVLRTLGAAGKDIMMIFICCGMFIGITGTICGVFVGCLISYNIESVKNFLERFFNTTLLDPFIYFLNDLPSIVLISDIINIIAMVLFCSFLSTLLPSYRASCIQPGKLLKQI